MSPRKSTSRLTTWTGHSPGGPWSGLVQRLERVDGGASVRRAPVGEPGLDGSAGVGVAVAPRRGTDHVAGSLGLGVDGDVGLGREGPGAPSDGLGAAGGAVERGVDPGDGEGAAGHVVDRRLERVEPGGRTGTCGSGRPLGTGDAPD